MSNAVMDKSAVTADAIRSIAESRRSVRRFTGEAVPDEDIRELLRLTGLAPSASNVQTWRWGVVRTPAMRERLVGAMTGANVETVSKAPASIVLYSDGPEVLATLEEVMHPGMGQEEIARRAGAMRERLSRMDADQLADWARVQTFIALGQVVLVARGLGYDTVTMGGFNDSAVKEVLGLPETARVTSVIGLGKRLQDGFTHHRHAVDRVSTWY